MTSPLQQIIDNIIFLSLLTGYMHAVSVYKSLFGEIDKRGLHCPRMIYGQNESLATIALFPTPTMPFIYDCQAIQNDVCNFFFILLFFFNQRRKAAISDLWFNVEYAKYFKICQTLNDTGEKVKFFARKWVLIGRTGCHVQQPGGEVTERGSKEKCFITLSSVMAAADIIFKGNLRSWVKYDLGGVIYSGFFFAKRNMYNLHNSYSLKQQTIRNCSSARFPIRQCESSTDDYITQPRR